MIIHGDCLIEMAKLPDESVDCIVTSPPYNLKGLRGQKLGGRMSWNQANISYGDYDDNLPEEDYKAWQIEVLNQCYRLVKKTGSIFYNHKPRMWKRQGHHPWDFIGKSKCKFYQEIIWNRGNTPAMPPTILFPMTERIYWLVRGVPKVFKKQVELKKDIWDIPPAQNKNHPAPFPDRLVEQCILLTTQPGDVVLDPFMGIGTTGIEAKRLDRKFIGIELNKEYFKIVEERIKSDD